MNSTTPMVTLERIWEWLGDVPDPELPAVSVVDLGIVRDVAWSLGDEDLEGYRVSSDEPRSLAVDVRRFDPLKAQRENCTQRNSPVLEVTITPTYTGCPATMVIGRDIVRALHERGVCDVRLRTQLDPPWTTDWLSDVAREKLRAYGIAPPIGSAAGAEMLGFLRPRPVVVPCPRCDSRDTTRISEFGSTPCKALYRCNACAEPFDYFKCH